MGSILFVLCHSLAVFVLLASAAETGDTKLCNACKIAANGLKEAEKNPNFIRMEKASCLLVLQNPIACNGAIQVASMMINRLSVDELCKFACHPNSTSDVDPPTSAFGSVSHLLGSRTGRSIPSPLDGFDHLQSMTNEFLVKQLENAIWNALKHIADSIPLLHHPQQRHPYAF